MQNRDWLDKCLNAAEMLYGVFPFGVLERLYGGNVIFGGRLGEYKYYDMGQVIVAALSISEQEWKDGV